MNLKTIRNLPNMHLFMDACADALQNGAHLRTQEREGQWLFNTLLEAYEKLAEKLRGTEYDPFYVDDRIPKFWEFVRIHWND